MLHVRRIGRREEFAVLAPQWNALLDPREPRSVFLRHEWLHTWFEAYGQGGTPHVLAASQGSELRGILPLVQRSERFAGMALRRLDLLANGHSPSADLIARPGSEDGVVAAFVDHFQEHDLDWDLLVLSEAAPTSQAAALFERFPASARLRQSQRHSPFIALEGDWDGFFRGALSKNFQRVLRNNRNRMTRAGKAEIELLEDAAAIEAALPDLFSLSDRSWQGEAGSGLGSTPENRRFYTGLVRALGPLGLLRVWFLRLDGRRIAFEFHVAQGGVEFGLKTGFDPDFESAGPGTFLDQCIVERLFDEGRTREYDLLGNADAYKLRWTERTREYVRWTCFGTRWNARLLSLWSLRLKPVLKHARALGRGTGATDSGGAPAAGGAASDGGTAVAALAAAAALAQRGSL